MRTTRRAASDARPIEAASGTRPWLGPLLALGLLGLSEAWIALATTPLPGIAGHVVLLVGLLVGAVTSEGRRSRLFLAMQVLPVVRLVSLAVPLASLDEPFGWALASLPALVALVSAARAVGYGRRGVDLTVGKVTLQALVGIGGIGLGMVEWFLLRPTTGIGGFEPPEALAASVAVLLFVGALEEGIFRGLLQHVAVAAFGPGRGIVYVGLVSAVMHMGWQSAPFVAFMFLVGCALGLVVRRTGSIVGVCAAQGIANVMVFVVLPLAVG